jgi:hypothetical protein
MLRIYLFFGLILTVFASTYHLRFPYSEEWELYKFLLQLNLQDPSTWWGFFEYQANHRPILTRILYLIDLSLGLRGSFMLLLSLIFGLLSCFLLDRFLIKRSRTVLERFCLLGLFLSLAQYETLTHPYATAYNIHNATYLSFIYFLATWKMPLLLFVAGINLLSWMTMVPILIAKWKQLAFRWDRIFVISFILCTLFTLMNIDAPARDPFHGQIYFSFDVLKHFILSYSLVFFGVNASAKLPLGMLFFSLNVFVFFKLDSRGRWVILGVALHFLMISLGRACSSDHCFTNATTSRYYTLLAPAVFVVLDYFLSRTSGKSKKVLLTFCLLLFFCHNFVGWRAAQGFKHKRLLSIQCLETYYFSQQLPEGCNVDYLFHYFGGFHDLQAKQQVLEQTSGIMRKLGYWESK